VNTDQSLPFEDQGDEQEDQGPSERVAEILATIAEVGFDAFELIELAVCCVSETIADLGRVFDDEDSTEADRTAATEAITRLAVAVETMASVDLGDEDLEEEGDDEEDEEEADDEEDLEAA
jgi:hypothetical protein